MLKVANSVINASRITGVLPVVNGGTGVTTSTGTGNTVLSAAPTLSGNVTLSTGNLVIGTAGKGIDFAATSGTGTSELLADYEEGAWTPTDDSGAGLIFTLGACTYTKVGRQVTCYAVITYPATASAAVAKIAGFPFTPSDRTFGQIAYTSVSTALLNYVQGAGAFVFLWTPGAQTTNASMSGGLIIFSVSFNV
jgi:hypothetical protein